jgi:small-conductance mechanosensitive channel
MKPVRRFRVYAKLLYLYPATYRKRYGAQLLQTVSDMVDDAPSAFGRYAVWLRISLDFPVTLCKEHFQTIGENMYAKMNLNITRNAVIGAALFLLPIIMLTINRMLMLSGPGRGIPTYYLVITSAVFPILAIVLSGFTLYILWRSSKATRPNLRQVVPLAFVCLASLLFLSWIISENIRYYNLTH